MKRALNIYMTILRDKHSSCATFRWAAEKITELLIEEVFNYLEEEPCRVETPLASTSGFRLKKVPLLLPILRSGMTMVPPFLRYFPDAPVGVVGLKRDEETAQAHWYYNNVPVTKDEQLVVILDPMIATGGTGAETVQFLLNRGIQENKILFVSIISSPEGIALLQGRYPSIRIISAACDQGLNKEKFIIPGIGDFGDRYFGTI